MPTWTVDEIWVAQLQGLTASFGSVLPPPPVNNFIVNGSFELPALAPTTFQYLGGLNNSWNYGAGSGVQSNGSAWGAVVVPNGTQSTMLQGSGSNISQTFTVPATASLTLQFFAARRNTQINPVKITLDGVQVGNLITPSSSQWQVQTVSLGSVAAGSHTIAFTGTGFGDVTTFIDGVSIG